MSNRLLLRPHDLSRLYSLVTDVERQPFRSMGFVSVIIVSGSCVSQLQVMPV